MTATFTEIRCVWVKPGNQLCLEGLQAGLSWETILKWREGYRKTFHGFQATGLVNDYMAGCFKLL